MRIGLRPVWLISTFCSALCNIGCARSMSYGAMTITRLLVAFFISPAMALGTKVVTQMLFKSERGQKMGIWTYVLLSG
jgi:predicted MFS family arabinose efflux permease